MTYTLYRFYDHADELLYVGCTRNFAARMSWHSENQPWWGVVDVNRTRTEMFASPRTAAIAERDAIAEEMPTYNVAGVIAPYATYAPSGSAPDITSEVFQPLREATAAMRKRPELIQQAREEGATWEQIADAAGMSRAGVIKLWNSRRQ